MYLFCMKKVLKFTSFLLALIAILFALLVAILYSKQDKIVQSLIVEYNETIPGRIAIKGTAIAPFQNFPYISIDIKKLEIFENKNKTQPFIHINDTYLGFDIKKIIRGQFEVKKIKLQGGSISIEAYSDGTYNLVNALGLNDTTSIDTSSEQLSINLKSIYIDNVKFLKKNANNKTNIEAIFKKFETTVKKDEEHIYADLNGGFLLSIITNDTLLFKEKKINIDTKVDYRKKTEIVTILSSSLKLEGVAFDISGKANLKNDFDLDLKVHGEKNDFSLLIALLPDELNTFMQRYKNAGNIFFDAVIKGKSINGNMPYFEANFGCKNGYFKNTNVNRTLDELSFKAYFTNGSERNLTTSEFRLSDFNAKPEQGLVKANLVVKNFTDPYVNLQVFTDFDLQFLADFVQMSAIEKLSGKVLLDANYNELVDLSETGAMMKGIKQGVKSKLTVQNLQFKLPEYPHLFKNINASATMNEGKLVLDSFQIKVADSDLSIYGYLSDLPSILHSTDKEVEIAVKIKSSLLNLDTLTTFDSTLIKPIQEKVKALSTSFKFYGSAKKLKEYKYLPIGKFELDDFYAKFQKFPHALHDINIKLNISDEDIDVIKFHGEVDKSDFDIAMKIYNYPKWFQNKVSGKSSIVFNIQSEHLYPADLLTFNGTNYMPEDYANEDIKKLKLKGKVDLNYKKDELDSFDVHIENSKAQLTLHPLKLENISGSIHGEKGVLSTKDLYLKMGNSDVKFSMRYHYLPENKHKKNSFILKSEMLDFDQLTNYDKKIANANEKDMSIHEDSFNIFKVPFSNSEFVVDIHHLKYHKIFLDNFKGRIRMQKNHYVYIDTLSMDIASGHIDLKGYLNGNNPNEIYFSPNFYISNLDLNKVMIKADNLGQEYVVNDNIKGFLSGTLKGKIKLYPDLFPVLDKSDLEMNLMVKNGVIVNYAPLRSVADFFKDKNLNYVRFDTLQNTFKLKNNQVSFPAMTINTTLGFIEVSGNQNLNEPMNMNYVVRVPWALVTNAAVSKLFGGRNKNEIPEDQVDDIIRRDESKKTRFININVTGNPEKYNITSVRGKKL